MIGKSFAEANTPPFEHFITLTYDDNLEIYRDDGNPQNYEAYINSVYARGRTNFKTVLNEILAL